MSSPQETSPATNRVRRYLPPQVRQRSDSEIERNIQFYAAQPDHIIAERIVELKREWSLDRYLQAKTAIIGLLTAGLALTGKRKWAVVTCVALGFLLRHAITGSGVPIPLLRQIGIRTRHEIDREIYALKALRGDFNQLPTEPAEELDFPAHKIVEAINA